MTLDCTLLDYDTAIAWPARIVREAPFLRRWLADAPAARVLDLGSGTGEHVDWLAEEGFIAVGIEGVRERWEAAKLRYPAGPQFLLGDLGAVEAMVRGQFGAAICMGNTLPAIVGVEALSRTFVGLRRRLLPGAPILLQQRNHDRVFSGPLPERTLVDGDVEWVFRRQLEPRGDGLLAITDVVLRRESATGGCEEEVRRRRFFQQGWRHDELCTLLEIARFASVASFSGCTDRPFAADESDELVLVAR